MKITKATIDRGLTIVAAASAPALTSLVDAHALSSQLAVDLGALVAAVVAAYHGGAIVQRTRTEPTVPGLD